MVRSGLDGPQQVVVMSMDMADDPAHVAKGRWRILDPALGVYGQAIGLAILTHPQFATVR